MNEPITIRYSLEEVLKRMDDKLDTIQKDVMDLKVGIATLTEKVEGMDKRLEKVEGTQKNQVWALIVLLAGAIATAGVRLFFTSNP
jgi:septal ring factor EnvC (AmiA/AmiB activator)